MKSFVISPGVMI